MVLYGDLSRRVVSTGLGFGYVYRGFSCRVCHGDFARFSRIVYKVFYGVLSRFSDLRIPSGVLSTRIFLLKVCVE